MNKLKITGNEMKSYHIFSPILAKKLGVKEAVIHEYIENRCKQNSNSRRYKKFGEMWMSESIDEIAKNIGYYSRHQVKDAIDALIKADMIDRAKFDVSRSNCYKIK